MIPAEVVLQAVGVCLGPVVVGCWVVAAACWFTLVGTHRPPDQRTPLDLANGLLMLSPRNFAPAGRPMFRALWLAFLGFFVAIGLWAVLGTAVLVASAAGWLGPLE